MADGYTCFIISPLGSDSSPEREHADDWYDLIVLPALQVSGFTVGNITRADDLIMPGAPISQEIMDQLEQADLCIADFYEKNPNVMYECGVRQGNGKPFIVLTPGTEDLPFDLAQRRSIIYDMGAPRAVRAAQKRLANMIGALVQEGFVRDQGRGTVAGISDRLQRIESQLQTLLTTHSTAAPTNSSTASSSVDDVLDHLTPDQAIAFSVQSNDLSVGERTLQLMNGTWQPSKYLTMAARLAARGSMAAFNEIHARLPQVIAALTPDDIEAIIGGFISFCQTQTATAEDEDFVDSVISIAETALNAEPDTEGSRKLRASLMNQRSRMWYALAPASDTAAEAWDHAVEYLRKAIDLDPDDPHTHYNLAMIMRDRGDLEAASGEIGRVLEIDSTIAKQDADHLRLAVEVWDALADPRRDDAFAQLKVVNPFLARIIRS